MNLIAFKYLCRPMVAMALFAGLFLFAHTPAGAQTYNVYIPTVDLPAGGGPLLFSVGGQNSVATVTSLTTLTTDTFTPDGNPGSISNGLTLTAAPYQYGYDDVRSEVISTAGSYVHLVVSGTNLDGGFAIVNGDNYKYLFTLSGYTQYNSVAPAYFNGASAAAPSSTPELSTVVSFGLLLSLFGLGLIKTKIPSKTESPSPTRTD